MLKLLVSSLTLACVVSAQAHYIPSDTPTTGTCNVIPFGDTTGSATWTNQIYQTIATAAQLGNTGGIITGIAFAPCGSGLHKNTRLRISLSHVPPGHIMQTTFALNMPTPALVLDVTNHAWNVTANQWNDIGLQNFFVYDGVSDLVMEIIAEGNINPSPQGFHRDTMTRVYATTWTGTPPLTGTTGLAALKWCVSKCVATVGLFGSGCAGLSHSYVGVPQLGAPTLDAKLTGAAPSSPAFLILGTMDTVPYPIDLSFLGFTGCNLYHDILVAFTGAADASGVATFPLGPVPQNPNMRCLKLFTQGGNLNPAAPGSLSISNYARLLFGI